MAGVCAGPYCVLVSWHGPVLPLFVLVQILVVVAHPSLKLIVIPLQQPTKCWAYTSLQRFTWHSQVIWYLYLQPFRMDHNDFYIDWTSATNNEWGSHLPISCQLCFQGFFPLPQPLRVGQDETLAAKDVGDFLRYFIAIFSISSFENSVQSSLARSLNQALVFLTLCLEFFVYSGY